MTTNDHDVAIVGAGPVGVVLAQLLARAGVRTLLVDREPDVLRIPRAIALDDDGSRVLQAIFVLAAAERTMPRIERVRMRSPRVGDLFVFDANRWRNGHPMLRMFHQPELEDRLREPLDSLATLRFLRGTTLESLSERGPLVHLTLRDAACPDRRRCGQRHLHGLCRRLRQRVGLAGTAGTECRDAQEAERAAEPAAGLGL